MIRYLVDQGVEVNAKNSNKESVLDLLKDESSISYQYVQNAVKVKDLVLSMSSVNSIDTPRSTPTVATPPSHAS